MVKPLSKNEKIVNQLVDENRVLYDVYLPHKAVKLHTGSETIVEQHHAETADISKIIGRYRRSGVLPERKSPGGYDDVSEVDELLVVKLKMATAMEAYESLPGRVTDQFSDVSGFLRYVEDQEQIIAQPVKEPEPAPEPEPKAEPESTPPAE